MNSAAGEGVGGERAGQKVRRLGSGFGYEGESPTLSDTRCASVHGFSLHANTLVPAHRRDQLERLLRSTARGAVSLERLERDANGDLLYTFTHSWSDGTTGIKLHVFHVSITLGVMNEKCYVLCMITSFKSEETEKMFRGQFSRKLPQDVQRVAARKLEQLHAATVLNTLRVPPGNRLEALTHDRQGQHSIRVNDQWRVCFVWRDGDAYDVEIVDSH